ncbi:ATP-dependent DNA ligase [Durotheca rogersii]|uniref:ATP-dependent DNA ligase n=1 Tax=Durotheca rogersii TaxID=419775 RepID=UPI00221E8069|nr:ATP-dependent DNA ligase [Durotheca rogersii]KAI5860613.1 ATP-dependent DNA ligase [Durotheca rogersii]
MSQWHNKIRSAAAITEERRLYATGGQTLEDLDAKYPNRPRNHSQTLLFSELFRDLFNPLSENKKQPVGPRTARSKRGPHGPSKLSPQEFRRNVVDRFISRWRTEVGNDIYPAMRLILPSSDRDRGMYGLKESNIGRLLVKLMRIDKNSEDAQNILRWKTPVQSAAARAAGDFGGRCFDIISKRPMRIEPGDMRIAEVNEMLDKLASASGESEQLPIFEVFYQRMNAEELKWLIRIILKEMKVGATERTFMERWHPDALDLFSVSSSLRQVCWDLYDSSVRLADGQIDVRLMQCFQPQLCHYQMSTSFEKMVDRLNTTNRIEGDDEFWIEEKLDGERIQLHMEEGDDVPGGKRFRFWSRKAKDYTYLYGEGFEDENSSLTRHLRDAFAPGVRNIILDGEMIVWDPEIGKVLKFGTLKTAALAEQRNPHNDSAPRPVLRVFDILYLNDKPLAQYTLRDRRNALEKAVPGVPYRLEVHKYVAATSADAIEPMLRKIISDASEGLVIKNPRSPYSPNERCDDWIKVKPDYMAGFGESVDVVVIGGYYGTGRRGGALASFLCGLRASENEVQAGVNPERCYSFVKVGGGFRAEDLADIRHHTEGRWRPWDAKHPPSEYVQLAGGERHQIERPDVWIRPSESVVISVKAASAGESDQFAKGVTLRFPRFKGLRLDRSWDSALDYPGFLDMQARAERDGAERAMKMESGRQRGVKRRRRDVVIAGQDPGAGPAPGVAARSATGVFAGLEFCVLTDCAGPPKRSKAQLEALIKQNGGRVWQRPTPGTGMVLVGEKNVVAVASLVKAAAAAAASDGGDGGDGVDIVRPKWILDCLGQQRDGDGSGSSRGADAFLLPFETSHLFRATATTRRLAATSTDEFGDSYARMVDVPELRQLLATMASTRLQGSSSSKPERAAAAATFLEQLTARGHDVSAQLHGHVFRGTRVYFAGPARSPAPDGAPPPPPPPHLRLQNWVRYGGGEIAEDLDDRRVTHIVVLADDGADDGAGVMARAAEVRAVISTRTPVPRVVSRQWVEDCWENRTLVDEERYAPP